MCAASGGLDDGHGLCLVDVVSLRGAGTYIIHVWWAGVGLGEGQDRESYDEGGQLHCVLGGDELVVWVGNVVWDEAVRCAELRTRSFS